MAEIPVLCPDLKPQNVLVSLGKPKVPVLCPADTIQRSWRSLPHIFNLSVGNDFRYGYAY